MNEVSAINRWLTQLLLDKTFEFFFKNEESIK